MFAGIFVTARQVAICGYIESLSRYLRRSPPPTNDACDFYDICIVFSSAFNCGAKITARGGRHHTPHRERRAITEGDGSDQDGLFNAAVSPCQVKYAWGQGLDSM